MWDQLEYIFCVQVQKSFIFLLFVLKPVYKTFSSCMAMVNLSWNLKCSCLPKIDSLTIIPFFDGAITWHFSSFPCRLMSVIPFLIYSFFPQLYILGCCKRGHSTIICVFFNVLVDSLAESDKNVENSCYVRMINVATD